MMALKNTVMGLVVLLILQTLWLKTSHSAQSGSVNFGEEVSKQNSIYRSEGERVPQGYVTDRSLLSYPFLLPSAFDRSLANLGPTDRWLDIGAGMGQAVLDYYAPRYDAMHPEGRKRRGKKARAVAMSIEDRRTPLWRQTDASLEANKIKYLFGRRLREYSLQELGQFQLITDVMGGFSYTQSLSLFMERTLEFLELNGSFYTALMDVYSENGSNRPFSADEPFLTEILKADGSGATVCSWLKSITCVQVTCESKAKSPLEAYHIHKVCNDVSVPALVAVHFEAGTPPARRFQIRSLSSAALGRAEERLFRH